MIKQHTFLLLFFMILTFTVKGQYSIGNSEKLISPTIFSSNLLACNITVDAGNDTLICEEDFPIQLDGSFVGNSVNYFWSPGSNVSDPFILNPLANSPGTYTLTVESVDDQNLVVNGDFENGDTDFTTDYATGAANVGNYLVTDSPTNYFNLFSDCDDHTTGMGNMMIVDGADIPDQNIWCQTINISANTDYYFSLWATMVGGTSPPELFFTANGNSIGDTSSIPLDNCLWTEISTIWNSGTATSVEFCIINNNISPFGNDFAIDDILVSSICEVTDEMEIFVLEANAIASNETIACIGDCIMLDGSNSTSGPAITHEWVSITGGSIQNGSTLTPTVCDTGIYKLIITSLDVPSGLVCYDSISIVVDLAIVNPVAPIFTGLDTICSGDTSNYQINLPDPNTTNYDWFVTNGAILNGQGSTIVEVEWSGISSGEICVAAINSCATSDTTCMSIVINSPPQEPIISGPTNVCNNTITSYSIPHSNNISNYQWSTPVGTIIQSGDGTEMITLDWGSVQGGDICLLVENNCGADSSCISVVFGSIQINIDSLNPLCPTENNGWIKVSPLAGTAPFSFLWGNGEMTDSIGGLSAGTYQVTISDNAGCSTEETIILQDPDPLNLTFSNTEITCNGGCDGIIAAEVTGGTAPYDFLWGNNLGTNDSLINICNGIYNITITDVNGCTTEGQTQLNDPPSISATISNDTTICQGESVNIAFQFTGIGPFDVELSDGAMHQNLIDGDVISIIPNATSTISITSLIDQSQPNCSANSVSSILVTINNPPALPIISGSDSTCQNTILNYCMTNTLMVDSFHWTIPIDANFTGQNTDCIQIDWANSNGGQVCVEAINECGSTQECLDVTLLPIPTSTFSVDPIICIDSTSTIIYTGTASPNAIFTWDFDGGNIISGSGLGPFEIEWTIAGNYNITLTVEENDCISTQTAENVVIENPIPTPVINCTSTTSTVTFTWNDVNGATGYQVNDLSGNGGMIIGNSYMVSGLANGEEVIIEVTAFGNNACGSTIVQASCTADDCPNINVLIDHIDPICLTPNTPTSNFTATTSGGNNLGNRTWSGNGIIDGATGLFDPNVAGVGVHDITLGYEENNCFYIDVVTIQIFETPTADFNVDSLICVNGNATITYAGTGSSNASYVWFFNGASIISGNSSGPYVVNWSTPGNYNITLTVEENGCQSTVFSQNIVVDPILDLPNVTCVSTPQSVIFSWDNVPNATDYFVTEISGPSGTQNGNTYEVTGMATGEEVVIEVTAIGSTICGTSTIQATCSSDDCPPINVEVEEVTSICLTQNTTPIDLNVTIAGSDNSGNGVWSGTGITDVDLGIFDPAIAGEDSHNITFTFQEAGCTFSDFIIIDVYQTPTADFSVDGNICINENSIVNYLGSASMNANYIWDFDGGTVLSGSGEGSFEINWSDSGNYNITLTVDENGCTSTLFSQNIQVDAALAIPNITCESTTESITFSWDDIAGASNYIINELSGINGVQNGNSIVYNNIFPGQEIMLEVTAVGNTICGNTTSMTSCFANDCPNIELIISPMDDVCLTNLPPQIPLQIIVNGSNGSGQGNWSGNGIVNDIFDPNVAGEGQHELTYFFTELQCDFSESIFVNVNLQPIAAAGEDGHLDCGDTLIVLDGSNSSIFGNPTWTTNSGNIVNGINGLSAEVNAPGVYYLTIENSGCTSIDSLAITQNISAPIANAGLEKELTCNQTCVILGGNNTSQGMNFTYSWTSPNGFVSTEIAPEVCQAGEYFLTVLNTSNNCISTTSSVVILENNSPPISQIESIGNLDCNNTSLVLDGSNSTTGSQIEYQWMDDNGEIFGETSSSFEATEQGNYYLQVLNNLTGCFSLDTIFLNDNTAYPSAEIATPELLTCIKTEVILDGSNSSNSSSIVYHWFTTTSGGIQSGGETNQAIVNQPGFYELIVLDTLNGCETTAPITVFQNIVSPNADAGLDIELDCNETEAMLGSENTSSGINFEYLWTSSNPNVTINSPTDLNPMVNGLGSYHLLVTNIENGCTSTDEMIVSQSPNIPQNINLEILESPCHGDDQGMIMIPSIDGGQPPYLYSLNGNPFSSSNIFNNLPIGDYDILIQDANGCELSTMISMSQPDSLSIDLGDNIYIELGDSVMLDPSITGIFDTIIWESSTNYSNCDSLENCYFPIVTPTQTTQMSATLINDNGCISMDQITIFVEKNRYVYIPNAFAPEGNSDNQIFMIYSGKGVEKINNFKVFSRWGEQLYEAKDFYPNDNSYGWNGNFKGEKMNPGVYVYFAEIEFSDGLKVIYKGDVTLTR
ncbi:MAG: gliding motility-associated C-terminal domain-containing protein [Saprospiraceae bacterium]